MPGGVGRPQLGPRHAVVAMRPSGVADHAVNQLLRDGHDAYRSGDADRARHLFERALEQEACGEALEGRAKALHLSGDYAAALAAYEHAYAAYRRERNLLGAARAARTLGWFRGSLYGDWAVYRGWIGRARTLLEQAEAESNEQGWILLAEAQAGSDLEDQRRLYLSAIERARKCDDADLECEALASLGIMLVFSGVAQGLAYLDEALATVCGGEVEELSVVESVFCGLFHVCERTHDVRRAEQWLRAADDLARHRKLATVAGYCRAYYGGILTAAGRWSEAEAELNAAMCAFSAEHRQIRDNVLCRLADLRLRQGRIEEAAELLAGLDQHEDAVRPLAALHLARGEPLLAQDLLERALTTAMEDADEGSLLALLADAYLATGAVESAERAVDRLSELAGSQSGNYLHAVAALARGKLCVAKGEGDARRCLHQALDAFAGAQLPVEMARTRLELAKASASTNPAVAIDHARSALDTFERLHASRDADAASALLRSLGAPSRPGRSTPSRLTSREAEVLELVGHGLTNAQIGERLYISPKTVEHHVGPVLSKLGLRSRAQAAAHAVRQASPPTKSGGR